MDSFVMIKCILINEHFHDGGIQSVDTLCSFTFDCLMQY
jgi:hypothetical protein